VEILWHELREKYSFNRVFETLASVQHEIERGLEALSSNHSGVTRLSGWGWIMDSILMNAN